MHKSHLARSLAEPLDEMEHEQATVRIPVEIKLVRKPHTSRKAVSAGHRARREIVAESGIYRPFRAF
jgi:hypothetical protein